MAIKLITMKLIDDLRRDNLAALVDEHGSLGALAERLDRDPSQVSQWLNGSTHSVTGKKRGMRAESARYIEKRCNKTVGWLDVDHRTMTDHSQAGEFASWAEYDQASPAAKAVVDVILGRDREPPWLDKLGAGLIDLLEEAAQDWLDGRHEQWIASGQPSTLQASVLDSEKTRPSIQARKGDESGE